MSDDHVPAPSSREDETYPRHLQGNPRNSSRSSSSSSSDGKTAVEIVEGEEGRRRRSSSDPCVAADDRLRKICSTGEAWEEQDENTPTEEEEREGEEEAGGEDGGGNAKRDADIGRRKPLTALRERDTRAVANANADDSIASGDGGIGNGNRPMSAPAAESAGGVPSSAVARPQARPGGDSDEGDSTSMERYCSPATAGLLLEDIELVNLHNLSLQKLEGMERLVFVRVADLSGNELHDTAPLRSCVCLEVRLDCRIFFKAHEPSAYLLTSEKYKHPKSLTNSPERFCWFVGFIRNLLLEGDEEVPCQATDGKHGGRLSVTVKNSSYCLYSSMYQYVN